MTSNTKQLLKVIAAILFLAVVSQWIFARFDLTQDRRYTLSDTSKEIVAYADGSLVIDVFLKGNFPPEFLKLQSETQQLLEEYSRQNKNIKYRFINPLDEGEETNLELLESFGLRPAQVSVTESGKQSVALVYPYALAHYAGQTVAVPLLKNHLGATSQERVNSSIQNLQYAFSDAFKKLLFERSRKIAVIKGNGELEDRYLADFFMTLREYYFIAPFTLDSVATQPQETLDALKDFDMILVAQPTKAYTEAQKYILDQYIMSGGKSLWIMDPTQMHLDPDTGKTFVFSRELNLNDFFFKYGVRINPNLVNDVYSAPIVLASGEDREAQYDQYPWFFSPLSSSGNNHPIVHNIEAVKFDYASAIDTLPNEVHKTVLLSTSPLSKIVGLPYEIDYDREIPKNLSVINEGPNPEEYKAGEIPLAVLLEGAFTSVYKNRIKPVALDTDLSEGAKTQMVVISDGSVIKNQMQGQKPLELGFDRMTNTFYGNKEFLLNTVNYLLDDSGLMKLRSASIALPFLDIHKATQERQYYQAVNLLFPLALLAIFGFVFHGVRRKKFKK